MTEKKQQYISTSWLPYMFQINFVLHFEFLSRELCTFSFWQYFRQWLPLS